MDVSVTWVQSCATNGVSREADEQAMQTPFIASRLSVKGCVRHPHGQLPSWLPQLCKAVAIFPPQGTSLDSKPTLPNRPNSYKSNIKFFSSKSLHDLKQSNTWATTGVGCTCGKGFHGIAPIAGCVRMHHHRCRRAGQMSCSLSSPWEMW